MTTFIVILLVIVALSRAGSALFWRSGDTDGLRTPAGLLPASATTLLLSGTAALMLAGGTVTAFTQATAAQLADRLTMLGLEVEAVVMRQNLSWRWKPRLLSLLHLGVKGIRIGPKPPAFVTPKIFGILQEKFDLKLTEGEPQKDLEEALAV